jgi:hypothetical protein
MPVSLTVIIMFGAKSIPKTSKLQHRLSAKVRDGKLSANAASLKPVSNKYVEARELSIYLWIVSLFFCAKHLLFDAISQQAFIHGQPVACVTSRSISASAGGGGGTPMAFPGGAATLKERSRTTRRTLPTAPTGE